MGLQHGGVGVGGQVKVYPCKKKGVCGKGFSHAEGGGGEGVKSCTLSRLGRGGPAMYPICSHPPLPLINDRLYKM